MNVKELRIGNYLLINDGNGLDGLVCEVCDIETYSREIIFIRTDYTEDLRYRVHYKLSELKPIPLTKEWLERFGFECDSFCISHKDNYFVMFKANDKDYVYTADMHHYTSEYIQHVHQLQNLYFSLTDEELEIIS